MQNMRYQEVTHTGLSALLTLLCLLLAAGFGACSEWNTYSLGQSFVPSNSQVRAFTHAVYVEYDTEGGQAWGPYADEVSAQIDGLDITISNASDSLALFLYGYVASKDSLGTSHCSVTIQSSRPYALYLNGLSLRSQTGTVIRSQGGEVCHLVLSGKTNNQLFGGITADGPLTLSGSGSLNVLSSGHCITAASLQCQYPVNVTLASLEGDGIYLTHGGMRSSQGTWRIHAAGNGITSPDSIVLLDGNYQGTALDGAFLEAPRGTILRRPTLLAASSWGNNVIDSALVATRYDSVQSVWQEQVDTLTLMADSLYKLYCNSAKTQFASFKPLQTIEGPYVLISNGTVLSSDTIHFRK